MKRLDSLPISIGAGALYPYSDDLMERLSRTTKFGDVYSLARVIGTATQRRIQVPRALAPVGGTDLRTHGKPYKFKSTFKPRDPEQARIISECKNYLDDGRSFMVKAPTGVGKTWMSTDIIAHVGRVTIVVVTKEDVQHQWALAIHKCLGLGVYHSKKVMIDGEEHLEERVDPGNGLGLIKGDVVKVQGCGVVIAFVQSIAKRERYPAETFKEFGFAIWDECHRVGADFFSQSAYAIPAMLRLGVSATTERKDGKTEVIEAHIGPVLVESTMAATSCRVILQRSPWKCPMVAVKNAKGKTEIVTIPHSPTACGHVIKMLSNHFGRNQMLCNFMGQAYKKDRKIMALSDSLDHLDMLISMMPQYSVPPQKISKYVGGLTEAQRTAAKRRRLIFCTYKMASEATDIPDADTLVMLTPKSDVNQIVGRIRRYHPDKKDPVVLDLIDFSSPLFASYAKARKRWYAEEGFEVVLPGQSPHS